MLLSTTLCYLLHHSSQQRDPKGKAMFFMKILLAILLARSGVAKYNLVRNILALLGKWTL